MNPHRIEILDRADDHDIVVIVAHHLHLVLFPPDDRFLDENLADGRHLDRPLHESIELIIFKRDAVEPLPPIVKLGPQNTAGRPISPSHSRASATLWTVRPRGEIEADILHRHLKPIAALGLIDHIGIRADHLDAELFEHAVAGQVHRHVQACLTTEGR